MNEKYIYCEDCNMFVDFWKYVVVIAGHKGHKWRYVTDEELDRLNEECEEEGCGDDGLFGGNDGD